MKLLSALVGVALSLSVGIENSEKLYKVQRTKTVRQRSTPQLERIQKKITEVRHITLYLAALVSHISLTAFPHPPSAAGEEGGDREHDGRHLQGSFSQEISVNSLHGFLDVVVSSVTFNRHYN